MNSRLLNLLIALAALPVGAYGASASQGSDRIDPFPHFSQEHTLATETPTAPTGFRGDGYSSTEILLLWNDNASNETGYEVQYRRAGSGTWNTQKFAPNVFWADITQLMPGTFYEFRLRATGQVDNSEFTEIIVLRT